MIACCQVDVGLHRGKDGTRMVFTRGVRSLLTVNSDSVCLRSASCMWASHTHSASAVRDSSRLKRRGWWRTVHPASSVTA